MRWLMSDFVRTQILLEKRQRAELDEIAKKEGRSFSELVRVLLQEKLRERKYAEMRAAAERLVADYEEGRDLTELTALDGEDFLNA
jgi:metal-responsive CopG/Arc/MetJ family transcriptional regulator